MIWSSSSLGREYTGSARIWSWLNRSMTNLRNDPDSLEVAATVGKKLVVGEAVNEAKSLNATGLPEKGTREPRTFVFCMLLDAIPSCPPHSESSNPAHRFRAEIDGAGLRGSSSCSCFLTGARDPRRAKPDRAGFYDLCSVIGIVAVRGISS